KSLGRRRTRIPGSALRKRARPPRPRSSIYPGEGLDQHYLHERSAPVQGLLGTKWLDRAAHRDSLWRRLHSVRLSAPFRLTNSIKKGEGLMAPMPGLPLNAARLLDSI